MNPEEMREALEAIAKEKGVEIRQLAEALVVALESAYHSLEGAYEHARVEINMQTWKPVIYVRESDEDGFPVGEEFDDTPEDDEFGRIAAQAFRQVMSQRVRQVVNINKYEEYAGREGDIVTGIIQQSDSRFTLLNLGGVEALLPRAEQVPFEHLEPNTRLKAYLVEVRRSDRGPQIVVSRTHPGLIRRLFELEVPEVVEGAVEIMACAREPGHRTKIAVMSNDENVDPVGACVGSRGGRVRIVVNELRGEKIDIVPFSEDPEEYVMRALSPAKIKQVTIEEETNHAEVIVHDYQLSLAIGKEGQNARLAARLTGYHIEIKSESQVAEEQGFDIEGGFDIESSDLEGTAEIDVESAAEIDVESTAGVASEDGEIASEIAASEDGEIPGSEDGEIASEIAASEDGEIAVTEEGVNDGEAQLQPEEAQASQSQN